MRVFHKLPCNVEQDVSGPPFQPAVVLGFSCFLSQVSRESPVNWTEFYFWVPMVQACSDWQLIAESRPRAQESGTRTKKWQTASLRKEVHRCPGNNHRARQLVTETTSDDRILMELPSARRRGRRARRARPRRGRSLCILLLVSSSIIYFLGALSPGTWVLPQSHQLFNFQK